MIHVKNISSPQVQEEKLQSEIAALRQELERQRLKESSNGVLKHSRQSMSQVCTFSLFYGFSLCFYYCTSVLKRIQDRARKKTAKYAVFSDQQNSMLFPGKFALAYVPLSTTALYEMISSLLILYCSTFSSNCAEVYALVDIY